MYIVIVGGGRVGYAVARWLVGSDQEVAVIDKSATACAALEEELGSITVTGDGTEAETLAKAGANRADIFIAAMDRDEENMLACQLAKLHFGAARTVSLLNVSQHERLFNILGIDATIDKTDLIVGSIQQQLSGVMVEELQELG